jgi:hypothetical protein
MKKLLLFLIVPITVFAQEAAIVEPIVLIDFPTAGTLLRGSFNAHIRSYAEGGLLGGVDVGLTDRFMIGLSYGGTNVIGRGPVNGNPQVGAHVRYRLVEEDYNFPAITIGYNSQGFGTYIDSTKRYQNKSVGAFAAISKNYEFLGILGLHGGINYSFETGDGDKDPNFFVGFDKSINPELALVAEYDFAINDNDGRSAGTGRGYLNAGLTWVFAGKLRIDFVLKNILENSDKFGDISREIRISYIEIF